MIPRCLTRPALVLNDRFLGYLGHCRDLDLRAGLTVVSTRSHCSREGVRMALSAGTRLGPYEILEPLGAGGMGEVYRARDTRLDRTVAIKVLPSELSANPALRERLEREARAVPSLNHPHICTLHDIGHQDGVDYLVLEHIEGETLADRLKKGPLPLDRALKHAVEIADALDKAHRHGVVHRDLKPGNIMLTKSGAKLLDFGLAKLQQSTSGAPATVGTATTPQACSSEITRHGERS